MASRAVAIAASSKATAQDATSSTAMRKTTKTMTYKTDASGNVSREVHTHVDSSADTSHLAMRKMEERIHILEEDLESEQHLRRRVEREKQELQMQIISLSERVTEAEGGTENQLDINRKREAEMAKLRKLLEDVHTESEQQIHLLRKKHQEAMMELQEQIEISSRSKEKITKENSTMKVHISELLAKIEILSEEKTSIRKVVEKLEINIHESSSKIQELNKTVIEITAAKQRLHTDHQESTKQLNAMKLAIDNAGLDKGKLAGNLKDLQSNLDGMLRAKGQADNDIKNLQHAIKVLTCEVEELRVIKVELETSVKKSTAEAQDWKKKYENEVFVHKENLDTLKKTTTKHVLGLEDTINQLTLKIKTLEQQKTKLHQECSLVIKDFEVSQTTIKDLTAKLQLSERKCEEIAIKLKEMTNMFEKSDRDSKARGAELIKLANELDRSHMENDGLKRDRAKLEDELKGMKVDVDAFKKRLHELEQENRKLAHDREELARAYKDTDTLKIKFEQRVQELELELKKLSKGMEVTMRNKEDEFGGIRKKLTVEIESLTVRLHDTEAKLRGEVDKIKKKMAVTITELEMSLDASNKSNVQLTNASKAQGEKIMQLTHAHAEASKNLIAASEQNKACVTRIQLMETEITKIRTVLEQTANAKKVAETKLGELTPKLNELSGLNSTLNAATAKFQKDLVAVKAEYTDIARELKLADERANKSSHDAQHFEGLLREEQAKFVKAENTKKALENEVRSLTVRMEEIETNTVASSRRTIQKMEVRIEELEVLLVNEKKLHVETTTALHKRETSVKALLLQSEEDRKNILILQESLEKLNEKIKMYKKQLEEQEQISNSNIMRVKKFQRELEAAESRAEEAESNLNVFRSRARVYASAESKRENVVEEVERTTVINKTSSNLQASSAKSTDVKISATSGGRAESVYRAGSTYSARAGSVARAGSTMRATSIGRAGSMLRY